jgi:hypothetical protein
VLAFREFERGCEFKGKKAPPVMKYVCVCSKEMPLLECAGTIGHVAHGKSTVVKAISGVQVILILMPSVHHMLYLCSFYKYCNKFIF